MIKKIGKWSDAELYLTKHFKKGYSVKPKLKFYSKEMSTDVTLFTEEELKDKNGVYLCFLERDKSINEYLIIDNQLDFLYHLPYSSEYKSIYTIKNDMGMYCVEVFKLKDINSNEAFDKVWDNFPNNYDDNDYISPELLAKASMKAMQALIISQPKISPKFAAKQAVEYANELMKILSLS